MSKTIMAKETYEFKDSRFQSADDKQKVLRD